MYGRNIALSRIRFDIDDQAIDLYHWFDMSSKRTSVLKEYFNFCDTDYSEITKSISIRW